MRSNAITTQPITMCLSTDTRPVMTVRLSRAVNRKQSCGVWHSKWKWLAQFWLLFNNYWVWHFLSLSFLNNPNTHSHSLTRCDVGQSLFLTEGQDCWFSLPRELAIQLYKLLCYVEVVKIVWMKVTVFVQDCPVHKRKKYQHKVSQTTHSTDYIAVLLPFHPWKMYIQ